MKPAPLLLSLAMLLSFSPFSKADPLKVGDKAPEVTGISETGAALNFGDVYRKNTYTLVYFFPKADTPGCTAQGCSLRDAYEDLSKAGVAVIGVSHDDVSDQSAFKDKFHFPFTLVADPDQVVIKAFGVPTIPFTPLASRQAYLIKDGKVVWCDYHASTSKQAADVLAVIASLGR
jgi:thioredoxin-dependent peroxiredoxin